MIHEWKFRATELVLETLPGTVGGRFAAELHAPEVLHGASEVRISLRCEETYHGTGSSPSTSRTEVLWQDEITISAPFPRLQRGVTFPVSFDIPAECPGLGEHRGPRYSISWCLKVSAELSGVNFEPLFLVPVYRLEPTVAR